MKKQLLRFMLFVLLVGCVLLTACASDEIVDVTPTFEGKEVTYNGSAHSIAVAGLPEGSSVLYSVNGGADASSVSLTDAGVYTVVAKITVPEGYAQVANMTATLKINKAPVPEEYKSCFADSTVAYTGEFVSPVPQKALPTGATYRVEGNSICNAGDTAKYAILFTYADTAMNANYENRLEDIDLTIKKADVDMSGISFVDATVPFDDELHSIRLTGTLPSFLKVSY
ncbi:MAG: hypothetical protein J6V07_06780, partial [Clostridia bacterium]|nr:hypothetical protein [Clostridia bacterium]